MTEKLKWQVAYQVGVPEVDKQHKKLFEMLNKLQHIYETGNVKSKIQQVLEEMGDYLNEHFSCEEIYLKNHPRIEAHRKEHWFFVEKTMKFTKDFDINDAVFEFEILDFLKRWLINHVLNTDIVYFRELNNGNKLQSIQKTSDRN